MTIPWMMNCPHSDDSWCLDCVVKLGNENADLRHSCAKAEVDIAARDVVIDRLEAQIAAHERVCAGTWVPVKKIFPPKDLAVIAFRPEMLFKLLVQIRDGRGRWIEPDDTPATTPTHWLDARLPTSSGEKL